MDNNRPNSFDIDLHFRSKIRLLRYFSTWWNNPSSLWLNVLEKSLSGFRISLLLLASILQLIQLTKMSNLKGASEIVEVMTLTISSSYKSAFFLYYQKDYAAMLSLMRSHFQERPFLTTKKGNKTHQTNMTKFLSYTDLIVYLYFFSAIAFISFSIIANALVPETVITDNCIKPKLTFHESLGHSLKNPPNSGPNLTLSDENLRKNLKNPLNSGPNPTLSDGNLRKNLKYPESLGHNLKNPPISGPNLTLSDENLENKLKNPVNCSKHNFTFSNCSVKHDHKNSLSSGPNLILSDDNFGHNLKNPLDSNLTFPDNCGYVQHNLNPKLPVKIWLPIDYSWTPLYQIVHLVTSFILYECCLIYVAQDAFCFTLLYAVSGQFQILEESLRNLGDLTDVQMMDDDELIMNDERKMNKCKGEERTCLTVENFEDEGKDFQKALSTDIDINFFREKLLHEKLGKCVQQHILLLRLLRDYERLMESMIIVDFLHAICSLSFALLEMSVAHTMLYAITLFCFIAICIVHQFMNNFFGEMVIQKQLSIASAVYSLPWERYPKKIKSSILFMLLRTEKPIVINGFKMYLLCYKTFVEFLKAIMSYYTVLRNVHLEK
ncbi:uncharacterized protein LOC111043672 [Nilaparvata lugens]|uniref:uncharacterized protein LOC111043672 n=1 Tax=Nilaparvata lugens TaxID=108931 RepID=UPI00193CF638|nr:uncharacterized protein LOC111043672 [Nilaparvata lugens]